MKLKKSRLLGSMGLVLSLAFLTAGNVAAQPFGCVCAKVADEWNNKIYTNVTWPITPGGDPEKKCKAVNGTQNSISQPGGPSNVDGPLPAGGNYFPSGCTTKAINENPMTPVKATSTTAE